MEGWSWRLLDCSPYIVSIYTYLVGDPTGHLVLIIYLSSNKLQIYMSRPVLLSNPDSSISLPTGNLLLDAVGPQQSSPSSPSNLPSLSSPSQLTTAPSSHFLKPNTLETPLTHLVLSHPHPICQLNLLVSTFKIHPKPSPPPRPPPAPPTGTLPGASYLLQPSPRRAVPHLTTRGRL